MSAYLDLLAGRLLPGEPRLPADHREAAVALVLRPGVEGTPEVLLMQRAERPGDRWSGQISLPGGHREPGDPHLAFTAARETREEVGLVLDPEGGRLGHLPAVQARARGRRLPLSIAPVVFAWPADGRIRLGEEARDAFWFPLTRAARGELDRVHRYPHQGKVLELPSWHHEGRTVWGLTHGILGGLLELLGPEGLSSRP